ncbi:unnamed protein product [Soboliphyme baturini]|uniref:DUF4708 domain-containing protein n=1 Tax=Soboliphyme baturini TaxID=241478 RepID=A0A183IBW9_9BILA|nr:unnamed protein product [Soboliphyme baturini]
MGDCRLCLPQSSRLCRELVLNFPDIMAAPLQDSTNFQVVVSRNLVESEDFEEKLRCFNIVVISRDSCGVSAFLRCLQNCITVRLCPEWNRVGHIYVKGIFVSYAASRVTLRLMAHELKSSQFKYTPCTQIQRCAVLPRLTIGTVVKMEQGIYNPKFVNFEALREYWRRISRTRSLAAAFIEHLTAKIPSVCGCQLSMYYVKNRILRERLMFDDDWKHHLLISLNVRTAVAHECDDDECDASALPVKLTKLTVISCACQRNTIKDYELRCFADVRSILLNFPEVVSRQDCNVSLFLRCIRHTIDARMSPEWNKIGANYIQDLFVTYEGSRLVFRCTGKELKFFPYSFADFSTLWFNDGQQREAARSCAVLPKLTIGEIVRVHDGFPRNSKFPNFESLCEYWENMYGFILPKSDRNNSYFEVCFTPQRHIPFLYPNSCVLSRNAVELDCEDFSHPKSFVAAFVMDLNVKIPTICGWRLSVVCSLQAMQRPLPLNEDKENIPMCAMVRSAPSTAGRKNDENVQFGIHGAATQENCSGRQRFKQALHDILSDQNVLLRSTELSFDDVIRIHTSGGGGKATTAIATICTYVGLPRVAVVLLYHFRNFRKESKPKAMHATKAKN